MVNNKMWSSLASILGTLLFIIYINNLHLGINIDSRPVLIADDTSVFITVNDLNELQTKSTSKTELYEQWFAVNGLSLNTLKTNALHLKSNHLQNDSFQISYQGKEINEVTNIKISCAGASQTYGMEKLFHYQLMHIMLKNTELLKHSKTTLQHVSVYAETIFRELQSVLG